MKNFLLLVLVSLIFVGCSKKDDGKEQFDKAVQLEKSGSYSDASTNFEQVANQYPESGYAPQALHKNGMIYQEEKILGLTTKFNLENAVKNYRKIAEKYPKYEKAPEALFQAAFILANQLQNYDEATKLYNLFLKNYPNHKLAGSAKDELQFMGLSPEEQLQKKMNKQ